LGSNHVRRLRLYSIVAVVDSGDDIKQWARSTFIF
jgi:hypothetical protein